MAHPAGSSAHTDGKDRSIDQVEAELAAARRRLAHTVDDLAEAVSPQVVAKRQVDKVKSVFVTPEGSVRTDRVAKVAGAVVGLLTLRTVVRRRSH